MVLPDDTSIERDIERRKAAAAAAKPAGTKKEPWPARAAEYLPSALQMGGEIGVGAITGPEAVVAAPVTGGLSIPAEMAAMGGAGGGGYYTGEKMRDFVRRQYNLPTEPLNQEVKDAAMAGGFSALGVPGGKMLGKLAPMTLKAGRLAKSGFREATEAASTALSKLAKVLGIDEDTARLIAKSPQAQRLIREPFFASRTQGFSRLSAEYEKILRPFKNKPTPNYAGQQYAKELKTFGRELGRLNEEIDILPRPMSKGAVNLARRQPSIGKVQEFRALVRQQLRYTDPNEDKQLIGALKRIEAAATKDINTGLPPQEAARLTKVDRAWGDMTRQYPNTEIRAVSRAPNAPRAAETVLGGETSQLSTMMKELNTLPKAQRIEQMTRLKKGLATYVQDAGAQAADSIGKLNAIEKALNQIPDDMFRQLYGMDRRELVNMISGTVDLHKRFLQYPSLAKAVIEEMEKAPTSGIVRKAEWIGQKEPLLGAIYALARGDIKTGAEIATIGPAIYGVVGGSSAIVNSAPARALYMRMLMTKEPAMFAKAFRALVTATATKQMTDQGVKATGTDGP